VTSTERLVLPTERMIFFRAPKNECLHLGRDAVSGQYVRVSEKGSSRILKKKCSRKFVAQK
jgi:hypothetical protein